MGYKQYYEKLRKTDIMNCCKKAKMGFKFQVVYSKFHNSGFALLNKAYRQRNHLTGFTLVEILVAVTIFSITIVAASGLFTTAIRGQRTVLTSQELLDQASYSMEFMSRALRMAIKETTTTNTCLDSGYGYNYETINGGEGIRFINHLDDDKCQEFYLDTDTRQLKERISSDHSSLHFGSPLSLTSDDLKIDNLKFNLSGEYQDDNIQPRVTILLEIERPNAIPGYNPKLKLQTNVSQRNLDVQY